MRKAPPTWLYTALDRLAEHPCLGYHSAQPPSAEPTALAALALAAHQRAAAASAALKWLSAAQDSTGRVATASEPDSPGWPTALAVMAWSGPAWDSARAGGVAWLLAARGTPEPNSRQMGHDMSLIGWSWVEYTHSWIEPTAMAVRALKSVGLAEHPRVREAVRLLWDRQLPAGGFNYGNTRVLGQWLRPHLLPTGLALLALADEPDARTRLHRSCEYLTRELSADTTAPSLAFGLLGLAAGGRRPAEADAWLASAYQRGLERDTRSTWATALLCLAAAPDATWGGATA